MGKIKNFKIFLDKPDNKYIPGEIVSGTIDFKVTQTTRIKKLNVHIKGEGNTHW